MGQMDQIIQMEQLCWNGEKSQIGKWSHMSKMSQMSQISQMAWMGQMCQKVQIGQMGQGMVMLKV